MSKEYFLRLYHFNQWANELIAKSLFEHKLEGDSLKLLSHIVNSQFIWLSRITGDKTDKLVWDLYSLNNIQGLISESASQYRVYLEKLNDTELKRIISYLNFQNQSFENPVIDILTHVVNHASYHRGQIARNIKAEGKTPPITDYIAYCRIS